MNSKNVTKHKNIEIPKCLTTNYYFFHPASYSYKRRANEERIIGEAKDFFKEIGFNITQGEYSGFNATSTFQEEEVKVKFDYRESCRNIYKTFKVYKGEEKKDIRLIKKMLKSL